MIIENNTPDELNVKVTNWQLIPTIEQAIDTSASKGEQLILVIKTQGENYYDLTVAGKDVKVFAQPNTTCHLTVGLDTFLTFTGELAAVQQYLYQKAIAFGSVDAEWIPRTNYTHGNYDVGALIAANDSITQRQLDFLQENGASLPEWYRKFEQKRQKYLHAGMVINSFAYRKKLLGSEDIIPENILETLLGDLPVEEPALLGSSRYLQFLNSYISYCKDPQYETPIPASKTEWEMHFQKNIQLIQERLTEPVRSVYLSYSLGGLIARKRAFFKEEWLPLIAKEELRNYLGEVLRASPLVPPGSQAPYFYLSDPAGTTYTPGQFKGKVLLINFWATWCRPCWQEFPFENQLVKQFEGKPVQIINICLDSKKEKWRELVESHQLQMLNLFASGNWNDKLYLSYDIQSLPHSVLIDAAGKIVENRCRRASEGIGAEVERLLEKME